MIDTQKDKQTVTIGRSFDGRAMGVAYDKEKKKIAHDPHRLLFTDQTTHV